EAFTRPKLMQHLSKLGFTQSYTYFIWRNTAWELREYFTELNNPWFREFFRPNLWPTTHDVLHHYLQVGGRPGSIIRLILAGTLSASYGIYGPAFELCELTPLEEGSEEFLNSEKYEIRTWNLDDPNSLRDIIKRLNQARRDHPALQSNHSLRFHNCTNDQMLCYTKQTDDFSDVILVVINLDPHQTHNTFVDLPLESLGLDPYQDYQLRDLLMDVEYTWFGGRNYVELDPNVMPAHVFWVKQWEET
ncbi:MAG: alpha-1,4-glucan--maltose-1-phosphate maltosyltransferase, partial [Cyanobacteria bacterium]|nr:alpha-1,4-glucan--maltose-1-phosphate maltosyltransferase [Cyanobacteriota bacterium]MDW8202670.1 alpha-1,4-glucan--maltose-1-phosphate maltosyltransferase [Cyanobacteriota bacterium SKYGB_h_bin112]